MPNPYNSPAIVTIRRVQTEDPNWVGGRDPEERMFHFPDLQEAYLFCVKEAGLEEADLRGDTNIEVNGWDVIPFSRLKEILEHHDIVEAFYAEAENQDFISMRIGYPE